MTHALPHRYLIALGSNQRHVRHGGPYKVIAAAVRTLQAHGCAIEAVSPTIASAPIGPSQRRYANAAAVIAAGHEPEALLDLLKTIERTFGIRRGQRWSQRVLDIDIILWSGGNWHSGGQYPLAIPHPAYRTRDFVLSPAAIIAGPWRDPQTGLTIRQQHFRHTARHIGVRGRKSAE